RSPRMAYYWLTRRLAGLGLRAALPGARVADGGFAGKYADDWIGPVYRSDLSVPAGANRLILKMEHHPQGHHRSVSPALWLNGTVMERRHLREAARLSFVVDLVPYRGTSCTLEVRTPEFFVPRFDSGEADDRRLSLLLV